jgi:NAD(P)-dependent dehydrogenase (short-subunit alcohol dehydrogenase family)
MEMRDRFLAGKVVWVTGSSRGIGRVVAAHLASLGASVALHGTTPFSTRAFEEGDSLEAVAQAMAREHQAPVFCVHGDLANEEVVKTVTAKIRSQFGRVDILVNCAGGDIGAHGTGAAMGGKPPGNDAVHISLEDLRSVLDRNLMTCILVCREVVPEMMERRAGKVVNFGSIAGLHGIKESVIYATAKAAVHEYTRCLAVTLRPYNVTVNAVAPGEIVTPRFVASRQTDPNRFVEQGTLERYGRPLEVARTIEFLVSEGGSYITGQVIRIDGGIQCWPA